MRRRDGGEGVACRRRAVTIAGRRFRKVGRRGHGSLTAVTFETAGDLPSDFCTQLIDLDTAFGALDSPPLSFDLPPRHIILFDELCRLVQRQASTLPFAGRIMLVGSRPRSPPLCSFRRADSSAVLVEAARGTEETGHFDCCADDVVRKGWGRSAALGEKALMLPSYPTLTSSAPGPK